MIRSSSPVNPSSRRVRRRAVSAVAPLLVAPLLVAVLAACGDSGDAEPAPEPTAEPAPEASGTVPDGPVSTLSPDLPSAFAGGVGPVDVIGAELATFPESGADPAVGQAAPTLVGISTEGDAIRVDTSSGTAKMLVFVAHWCPHCNDEIPRLNDMSEAGAFPDDLEIVAISTAAGPDRPNWPPDEWLRETMEWRYPAMLDGIDVEQGEYIAAAAYGVSGFPFVVLVNPDGTVATRWSGQREPEQISGYLELLDS
jgi:thiol-disulfide isomerase/thioredoxin